MVGGGIVIFAREVRAKFFATTPTLSIRTDFVATCS